MSGHQHVGRRRPGWGVIPIVLIVALLMAPSLIVVSMSFSPSAILSFPPRGFSLTWYRNLVTSSEWTSAIGNSAAVAVTSALLSGLVGVPAAIAFGLRRWRGEGPLLAAMLTPAIVPPMVLAIGMYVSYAQVGLIGFWGLVAAHTVLCSPFVLVTVLAAVRQLDVTLLDAARSLGARPIRVIASVILPTIAPSILSGMLFAFVTSWDEVVVALYLTDPSFKTLPVVMWDHLRERVDPTVAAIAAVLFAVTTLVMLVALVRGRRRSRAERIHE